MNKKRKLVISLYDIFEAINYREFVGSFKHLYYNIYFKGYININFN